MMDITFSRPSLRDAISRRISSQYCSVFSQNETVRRYRVKWTLVRIRICAPESGATGVRDPWTKTMSQQAEKPENNIAVCTRIDHYLVWYLFRLLLKNDSQNDRAIPERSRNNDVVYPRLLVRYQVVPYNPTSFFGVFRLGPAGTVRTGTTNRIPSANVTSLPPQIFARGTPLCAATRIALAALIVSSLM